MDLVTSLDSDYCVWITVVANKCIDHIHSALSTFSHNPSSRDAGLPKYDTFVNILTMCTRFTRITP